MASNQLVMAASGVDWSTWAGAPVGELDAAPEDVPVGACAMSSDGLSEGGSTIAVAGCVAVVIAAVGVLGTSVSLLHAVMATVNDTAAAMDKSFFMVTPLRCGDEASAGTVRIAVLLPAAILPCQGRVIVTQ
ncbi:MAG: hypothetical protein L0H25_04180 [Micrococcales bacterium]|nr:hypothetical protein [Micrococcales bacterium]